MLEVLAVEMVLGLSEDNLAYLQGCMTKLYTEELPEETQKAYEELSLHGHDCPLDHLHTAYMYLTLECVRYIQACGLEKDNELREKIIANLTRLAALVLYPKKITLDTFKKYLAKGVIPASRDVCWDEKADKKPPLEIPFKEVLEILSGATDKLWDIAYPEPLTTGRKNKGGIIPIG